MAERAEIVVSARDATGTAFQAIQSKLTTLKAGIAGFAGGAAFGAITAAAEGLAHAFTKINPTGAINAADELYKLSQRAGIAVEDLSALSYAGKLADVDMGELGKGLQRLNQNIAAAAAGEREQAEAFAAIGVSVKDASGQVRSAGDVLDDVAEKFAGYADGANKVALANALGGRSFTAWIPLLNQGSQGLRDARTELEQFGGVIGTDLAQKSEIFNDNLTKLGVAADSLKIAIAGGLIDSLVDYSNKAVEAAKSGGLLEWSLERLRDLFTGKLTTEFVFGRALPPDKIREAQTEVDTLNARVSSLQGQLAQNPGNAGLIRQLQLVSEYARSAQQDLNNLRGMAAGGGRGFVNPPLIQADPTPAKPKPQAPALPAGGRSRRGDDGARADAAAAEARLRRELDGRLAIIRNKLEEERDLFRFAESRLSEQFQHGELSIQRYYDNRNRIQTDAVAAQQRSYDAEIAALRQAAAAELALLDKFPTRFKRPQERRDAETRIREESETRINDVLARQARAYREAGQATEVAETQRSRATTQFRAQLQELDAQLADLSGDRYGAELLRNARTMAEARDVLSQGGGDPAREANLRRLLQVQAEFNAAQDANARLVERAQMAEEALLLAADRTGRSRIETEAGVRAVRQDAIRQLDELIARTKVLTETSKDPEILAFYDRLRLARERAFDVMDPAMQRFRDVIDETSRSLASGFEDAIVEGKSLGDVFKAAERDFVRLITRDFLTTPLATSMSNWAKQMMGVGGQQAGGLGGGDLFSWVGDFFTGGQKPAAGAAPVVAAAGDLVGKKGPADAVRVSFTALQAAGIDPTTAAFQRLQGTLQQGVLAQFDPTRSGEASVAALFEEGGSLDAERQAIAGLFDDIDASQAAASDSARALGQTSASATMTLTTLAAAASRGSGALALLPSIINSLASSFGGSSSGGGGWLGAIAGWFSGGGSSGFGTGSSFGSMDLGAFYHSGGIVGAGGGNLRPVPAGVFAGAPRYHTGGIAGLAPDERPAILRKREEVIRTDDPRHRDNGGWSGGDGRPVVQNNTFVIPPGTSREMQSAMALKALQAAERIKSRDS